MTAEAFLEDIKQNEQVMRLLGNPVHVIDDALNEVAALKANQRVRDYAVFTLSDRDYGLFSITDRKIEWKFPVGTVLSNRKDGLVDRPYRVKVVGDEIWVLSYYMLLAKFDLDFSFKGFFGSWGDYSAGNYVYPRGFAVSEDRVYMVSDNRHVAAAFDRHTQQTLWVFGSGSPGLPEDGKLYAPYDVDILPDGHILIACYYGRPADAVANSGMVIELDENGEYVRTHLAYRRNGGPWVGDVSKPVALQVLTNPHTSQVEVWIAYFDKDLIAVFEWDGSELVYQTVYSKTPGLNVGSISVRDFVVDYDNNRLYAGCDAPKVVACIDLTTSNLLGYIGGYKFEDYDGNPETPGGFGQVAGLALTPDGRLIAADYSNNRIQQFPKELITAGDILVEYRGEIPDFKKVEYISDERFSLDKSGIPMRPQKMLRESLPPQVFVCGLL